MNVADSAWVAGILEGEGSFHVNKRHEPKISVSMTDEDVVRALFEKTEIGRVSGPFMKKGKLIGKTQKPFWLWTINKSDDVVSLINEVLPFLFERRSLQALKTLQVAEEIIDRKENKRRFCAKGHDKDTVGRTSQGQCTPCTQESWRASYHRNKNLNKEAVI